MLTWELKNRHNIQVNIKVFDEIMFLLTTSKIAFIDRKLLCLFKEFRLLSVWAVENKV